MPTVEYVSLKIVGAIIRFLTFFQLLADTYC